MAGKSAIDDAPAAMTMPPPPLSPFVALKHRDYLPLLVGRFVSTIGRQMRMVAIAYQVHQFHRSALQLRLVGVFRIVPVVTFSLAGGPLADVVAGHNWVNWKRARSRRDSARPSRLSREASRAY